MNDRPPDDADAVGPDEPSGTPGTGDTTEETGRAVVEHAEGVDTVVVEDRGQWAVDIIVYFPDSVVRRRINVYRTKARAEISARLIKRGAEREIEGPLNG